VDAVDTGGAPTASTLRRYSAFGVPGQAAPAQSIERGFASRPIEGASGLVYMRARHYDPTTGRFLQPDPEGIASTQRYAFAEHNPYIYNDPTGRSSRGIGSLDRGVPSWAFEGGGLLADNFGGPREMNAMGSANVTSNSSFAGVGHVLIGGLQGIGQAVMDDPLLGGFIRGAAQKLGACGSSQLCAMTTAVIPLVRGGAYAAPATRGLATGADKAVFWSGIRNGDTAATNWITRNGGATLETTLIGRGIKLPVWDRSNPASISAWRQALHDFAAGASGNVRVLQSDAVRLKSIWAEIEFPALRANSNVNSIRAVNPETRAEVLLWSR
jgi:RHS repeat-associated protein